MTVNPPAQQPPASPGSSGPGTGGPGTGVPGTGVPGASEPRPVVLHDSEAEREVWDDPVKGLLGFRGLFSSERTPTNALTTGVTDLPPDGWLGLHRHTPAEVYYVLDGEGVVTLDGVEHAVRTGTSVFIPGDVEHGIRNTTGSALRLFYVFAVDSFATIEYRFS